MVLNEKETTAIKDLQTQEQMCIKNLFQTLKEKEQKHYDSLEQVLKGNVPSCDCNDSDGNKYEPKATYNSLGNTSEKEHDSYLVTDCISSEKLVSGEYNNNVFIFANSAIRKLLADIQMEEQNHAEMLYKYKTVNGMA